MNASRGSDAGRLRAARVSLIVFCLSLAVSGCEEPAPRGPRICAPLGLGALPAPYTPALEVADGARRCACRAEQVAAAFRTVAATGAARGAVGTAAARASPSHGDRRARSARADTARSRPRSTRETRRKRRKALPRPVVTAPDTQGACVDIRTADAAALEQLPGVGPSRAARIVELRFFGGLTIEETATAVGASPATVKRSWTLAKAWLKREMGAVAPGGS